MQSIYFVCNAYYPCGVLIGKILETTSLSVKYIQVSVIENTWIVCKGMCVHVYTSELYVSVCVHAVLLGDKGKPQIPIYPPVY